jgi:hypothetical protein
VRPLLLFLMLLAAGLPAAAAADDFLLARWKGGELTYSRWQQEYAAPGQTVDPARPDLYGKLVAKAVFRDIYRNYAREIGLEGSPEAAAELKAWRAQRLSQLYRERQMPDFAAGLTDEKLRGFHQQHSGDLFWNDGRADLTVLYLRCSLRPAERAPCRERMAELRRRLAAGEELAALAAEEKAKSGPANGDFRDVALRDLVSDLRKPVGRLAAGETSAPIEAPHGLFLARLERRWNEGPLPFEKEKAVIRSVYLREMNEAWQQAEAARLGGGSREEAFAAAAAALGLDREARYLRQEANQRNWILTDLAFYRDRQVHPPDAVLAARIATRKEEFEQLELVLASLPADQDREGAFTRAGEFAAALKNAGGDAALLEKELPPGLALRRISVRRDALARRFPALEKALADLPAGKAVGPVPLESDDFDFASERELSTVSRSGDYRFLLFAGVVSRRLPAPSEVLPELLAAEIKEFSQGPAHFLPFFAKRWQIELFPEEKLGP